MWRNFSGALDDPNFDIDVRLPASSRQLVSQLTHFCSRLEKTTYGLALFWFLLFFSGIWPHAKLLSIHIM